MGTPERKERFPKRERLRVGGDFRRAYDQGDAYRGTFMVMIVHRSSGFERRAGFVSSRKVGNAVQRNRARRLLRESYRRLRGSLLESGEHVHFVFIARRGLPADRFENIFDEMQRLMWSAGVLGRVDDGSG